MHRERHGDGGTGVQSTLLSPGGSTLSTSMWSLTQKLIKFCSSKVFIQFDPQLSLPVPRGQ